jgi:hypothetical protein
MKKVATNPIKPLDPMYLSRSFPSTPDKYLIMAVLVIPNLNISTNDPDEINSTHCPKTSKGKLRARSAKPAKPKNAMVRFPTKDRKLSSLTIFLSDFFKLTFYLSL